MMVLDLFSGIGGFSLGLERAGMKTAAFCEIDPYCRAVLRKHWAGVPIHENVKELNTDDIGPVHVVCGGFPCQPWSLAGKRRGTEDDRNLWPEMRRIIAGVGPRWIIAENVPGLDNKRHMGLDTVLSDLEALDYSAVTFEIPACAVDAPHRRSRLWVVAHTVEPGLEGHAGDGDGSHEPGREQAQQDGPARPEGVHDTIAGRGHGETPRRREKRGGAEPSRWLPEPGVGRVANGIPSRVDRLKALGNAIVPQVVEQIGRAIMQGER